MTEPIPIGTQFIDNGTIRVGVNLDLGGAITFLAPSGADDDANIVNNHDPGRQIQMSFYSGPVPYGVGDNQPSEHWKHLGWNPIQAGDAHGHGSEVVAFESGTYRTYVKCVPLQWPLDHLPAECTFETWITLDENRANVRCRLENHRSDTTAWPARHQELPAVYTNGPYYRLMTYTGKAPWTDSPVSRIGNPTSGTFPWSYWSATENWAALLNDDDRGLGVYHPGAYHWIGGFSGKPGSGGTDDAPCGYLAPLHKEQLDHNIVYEYSYTLILGTLNEIRSYAKDQSKEHNSTAWDFDSDRAHWVVQNGTDAGWPIRGSWRVGLSPATVLESPWTFWQTEEYPALRFEAAFRTEQKRARLCWRAYGSTKFNDCVDVTINGNGAMQVYDVPLAGIGGYEGEMVQLQLYVPDATEGDTLELKFLSLVHAVNP